MILMIRTVMMTTSTLRCFSNKNFDNNVDNSDDNNNYIRKKEQL